MIHVMSSPTASVHKLSRAFCCRVVLVSVHVAICAKGRRQGQAGAGISSPIPTAQRPRAHVSFQRLSMTLLLTRSRSSTALPRTWLLIGTPRPRLALSSRLIGFHTTWSDSTYSHQRS